MKSTSLSLSELIYKKNNYTLYFINKLLLIKPWEPIEPCLSSYSPKHPSDRSISRPTKLFHDNIRTSYNNLESSPFRIISSDQYIREAKIIFKLPQKINTQTRTTFHYRGAVCAFFMNLTSNRLLAKILIIVIIPFVITPYFGIEQETPLSMEHLPVTGSGSEMMINGASSKNVILMLNFSGTPCGGTWL